MTYNDNLQTTY